MSFLAAAYELANIGFHVFPLLPNSKKPYIENFPHLATRDPSQISRWWMDPILGIERQFNIGISTTKFGLGALLAVDVDNKNGKDGSTELLKLEMEGFDFPSTFYQTTPTGGSHLIYSCPTPLKQGISVFGPGLDIRSKGGYLVGAGSVIDGRQYLFGARPITEAPQWMVDKCGAAPVKVFHDSEPSPLINSDTAVKRAIHYLSHEAPISIKGHGGDQTAYIVACKVKDFGVNARCALELMMDYWNDRCPPGWSFDRLKEKVEHAYRYGQEAPGSAAPEIEFDSLVGDFDLSNELLSLPPMEKLNQEYAFVIAGGGSHILWQTKGPKGEDRIEHLGIQAFHQKLASQFLSTSDGKTNSISHLWMKSKERKSYDGICFMPGLISPPKFFNLWRGFSITPSREGSFKAMESLATFLQHARENVCNNDPFLFKWLIGYFAHMMQKPWEKPLVALVFRGGKGVGKNALVDRVGHLISSHYLLTSNRRYLLGNFNGFLENLLLFALDEAFWSGDKQSEGALKDLITGKTHIIEHKGKESYVVDNCLRICIIGNEEWVVPASADERRFAVFDVGDKQKQNNAYFQNMREGMEQGGYALLLQHLLDFDISTIEVNKAPSTSGLMDQKFESLDPFQQWWSECLSEGRLIGSDFDQQWPLQVEKERFRQAYRRYVKEHQIRARTLNDRALGKMLKQCLPSLDSTGKMKDLENGRVNCYRFPNLDQARAEWDNFIGHKVIWGE